LIFLFIRNLIINCMKLKALIVDDEVNARQALFNLLKMYCPDIEVVGEAGGVKEGYAQVAALKPELVFLDIRLNDGTGFDMLRKTTGNDYRVIFVTAYDQYALNAIRMSAVDYLLKPINPTELVQAVEKAVDLIHHDDAFKTKIQVLEDHLSPVSGQAKRIILNTANSIHVVDINNIIRCESDENYTYIITTDDQSILVSKTLKEFDELLTPSGFCRVHQSHLVNMYQISSYEKGPGGMIIMKNKDKVPVSGRRKDYFLKSLDLLT